MNILHLFPKDDPLIVRHVGMIDSKHDDGRPDIVHVHGCWQYKVVRQALQAHRQGARIVFTPHGGLEPWIINERRLSEKLCKTLLWQRRLVECSYVVIVQGSMEAEACPRSNTSRMASSNNASCPFSSGTSPLLASTLFVSFRLSLSKSTLVTSSLYSTGMPCCFMKSITLLSSSSLIKAPCTRDGLFAPIG